MRENYRYKNRYCTICGAEVDPFHYRFYKGEKVCIIHKKELDDFNKRVAKVYGERDKEHERLLSLS